MKAITKQRILDNNTVNRLVGLWNLYCDAVGYYDDTIHDFDETTIDEMFSSAYEALRSATFGEVSFTNNYFNFDGYGNINTLSDWEIEDNLDWDAVAEWLNKGDNDDVIETFELDAE